MSWTFSDTDPTEAQKNYQILVSSSKTNLDADNGNIWDTGKTIGSSSSKSWGGGALSNEKVYWWKARVWDQNDNVSVYSPAATFATTKAGPSIITETVTQYQTSYLAKYLKPVLPKSQQHKLRILEDEIDKLKQQAENLGEKSIEYINKPFGIKSTIAYPIMLLSLFLNLVWITRVAVTRTKPYIP